MANVTIDRLAETIAGAVKDYTEDVVDAVVKEIDDVASLVLNEIKTNHPYRDSHALGYTSGFKKSSLDEYGRTRRVIWNRAHYRRVHLLEFGHAKVNGGRVKAYPHMRSAYEKHGTKLYDRIKQIIKNGG